MKQTSYTSYDFRPVTVVPVIASFDSDGRISPLYVRIQGEPLKIQSFRIRNAGRFNTTEFHCMIISQDKLIPLAITFHQFENIWTIPGYPGG